MAAEHGRSTTLEHRSFGRAGLVDSLARPGGNTTGFTAFEYAIGAKWLELLKEVAPGVTPEEVQKATEARLRVSPELRTMQV